MNVTRPCNCAREGILRVAGLEIGGCSFAFLVATFSAEAIGFMALTICKDCFSQAFASASLFSHQMILLYLGYIIDCRSAIKIYEEREGEGEREREIRLFATIYTCDV
jgi:hypothetical protein